MPSKFIYYFIAPILCLIACSFYASANEPDYWPLLEFSEVANGLSEVTEIVTDGNNDNSIYVTEKGGVIRVITNGVVAVRSVNSSYLDVLTDIAGVRAYRVSEAAVQE